MVSKVVPKTEVRGEKTIHFSVGAIITNPRNELLLIDRVQPPLGFAGVAGHVDEGETPLEAIVREVSEEGGLLISDPVLLLEEFVSWNYCAAGVTGHHWYLFGATAKGRPVPQAGEVKSIGWYEQSQLSELNLEEVWRYWFEKLGYLK